MGLPSSGLQWCLATQLDRKPEPREHRSNSKGLPSAANSLSALSSAKPAAPGLMSSKGKLSKEQLRALRAQRAAALAAQQQQAPPAAAAPRPAAAASAPADNDARSMPPPPPRAPSATRSLPALPPQQQQQQQRPAASYHADSQGTRLHDPSALHAAPELHAEPSINQRGGRGSGGSTQEEVRSTLSGGGVPADFFEQARAPPSVVGSAGPSAPPSAAAGAASAPAAAPAEAAMSLEGSTGAGAAAGAPAGGDVTSSASLLHAGNTAMSGIPAGFFDHSPPAAADSIVGAPAGDGGVVVSSEPAAAGGGGKGGAGGGADGGPALPKGFFEDKKADAKARGEVPKTEKDLTKEYADFMRQVEVDSAAAAQQVAAEEEEEAAGRLDREDFEQFVRMQKLEALKEARAGGGKRPAEEVDAEASAAAAAIAEPEVQRPFVRLPKKRRVMDTIAELEGAAAGGGSSSEEEEEGADLLDWRAKKSAF